MQRACVALADAASARLYTFVRDHSPGQVRDELSLAEELANPDRRKRPSELFTESRPPQGRTGNLTYGTDDHRDEHLENMDDGFAAAIADATVALVQRTGSDRLIVCASPNMLGKLRVALERRDLRGVAVDDRPRDLVRLTPPEVRAQLADYGLLPPVPARHG